MTIIEQHELKSYIPLNNNDSDNSSILKLHSSTATLHLQPSLWKTKEFLFYYLCMLFVIPHMFYTAYQLSIDTNPNYQLYSHLLSDGWIFGRKVDNSDIQYSQFRTNLPTLVALAITYLILSHLYRRFITTTRTSLPQPFFLVASLIIVAALHGAGCIKILILITSSYLIGQFTAGSIYNPILTWTFNLAILFLNERYHGYKFEWIGLTILDEYSGLLPRWQLFFKISMLRLISFNMDYYWQFKKRSSTTSVPADLERDLTDRERISTSCPLSDYTSYSLFLTYILYIPLYICGPIMTFNNFVSQLKYRPSSAINLRSVTVYAIRLVAVILVMELTLHTLYVVAISKAQAWAHDTPFQISMVGYFNLVIVWMKLLIPWRFFRLWAMADGMHPEENMIRCMSNNFSAQRFWKSWHRSFNRWTIRYIYIPLGGSRYMGVSMWVVFTFVAVWHDVELKLLAWGWLICLFLVPEMVASRMFTYKKFGQKFYYRVVCGLGAAANILMMMAANLVGFVVGLDGTKDMIVQIFSSTDGLVFLTIVIACLYIAAQVMFEIRESEKRRGDPKWML